MDLLLFILLVILAFMLYYMIAAMQSLVNEMREVKNKCIKINGVKVEEFKVSTDDPAAVMKDKASRALKALFQ